MSNRLRDALNQVQAGEELKEKTKEYLYRKTKGYTRARRADYRQWIPAAACAAVLLIGGSWLYFTPTAVISMDVNPSMELGVNRFDRVISVKAWNDDGQKLAESVDVKHLDCVEAVSQILQSEEMTALLSGDEVLTVGVIGETDNAQSVRLLAEMQICTEGEANTYCYSAHADEAETAHEQGFSCGKYRAFRELQELDPSVTADQARSMTMREIYDRIAELSGSGAKTDGSSESAGGSGSDGSSTPESGSWTGHGHHGEGGSHEQEHQEHR